MSINCHPHDTGWIDESLKKLEPSMRETACKRYSEIYNRGALTARSDANLMLRTLVETYGEGKLGFI